MEGINIGHMAVIRAATLADVESIAQVHVAAWQAAYRGIIADDHLDGLDWREWAVGWREHLADTSTNVRSDVALQDGSVVGFVATGPERDSDASALGTEEVYAIYVSPSSWGHGIGRELMRRVVADLGTEADLVLWVLAANTGGRAFYERERFRPDGAAAVIRVGAQDLPEVRYRLFRAGQVAKPSDR
jgi:GNAT superfamily N-acetyltransferase